MSYARRFVVVALIALIALALVPSQASPVSASRPAAFGFSGTIASDPEFDLYTIYFPANVRLTAKLDCAPAPNNTLDTIVSVFFPGNPYGPSDLFHNDVLNDDGGPLVCEHFHSSLATFVTPVAGDYTFRVDGYGGTVGDYSLTIFESGGCESSLNLSGAVVGRFVADAPLYSEPGVLLQPALTIPAGQSYWVSGLDASGQYYRIFLQCSAVWVPVGSMGPNFDNVWNGTPLPTTVVQ